MQDAPRPTPPPPLEHRRRARPLSLKMRILLFVVGWLLVAIGILGLALPGIQGILTILVGAAVLSLVSEWFYRVLHRLLGRWPKIWTRLDDWRDRIHARLQRRRPDDDPSG